LRFALRSGEVTSVELHDEPPAAEGAAATRSAIVSFLNASSLDTALLLSGGRPRAALHCSRALR
jgi:hypothetical protein